MKFSMIKTRKPRQFDFPSRYYDAEKEALERRVKEIKSQANVNDQLQGGNLSFKEKLQLQNKMNDNWRKGFYQNEVKKSNKRMLLIMFGLLALLLLVVYKYL